MIKEYTKHVMHYAIAHVSPTNAQLVPVQQSPPWPASPKFMCSAWCHMVWNIPLASWRQLSWLWPLPAACASAASPLAGQCEKLRSPWLSVSTAQQHLNHQCVINIILIPNPKQSTISATRKKINSIPAETRTESN